jgi:cytochrome c5
MRMIALILLTLALMACSRETPQADAPPAVAPAAPASAPVTQTAPSPTVMGQWTRNCALCHVRGEGGAPVLGDIEAWAPRMAQGEEVLLKHTIEGLNNMPPLGYCQDCEAEDFRALIRFMGGRS